MQVGNTYGKFEARALRNPTHSEDLGSPPLSTTRSTWSSPWMRCANSSRFLMTKRRGQPPKITDQAVEQPQSFRGEPMTVNGQNSCPPPGSFVSVSELFLVSADITSTRSGANGGSRIQDAILVKWLGCLDPSHS